jgi:hypothetical protein
MKQLLKILVLLFLLGVGVSIVSISVIYQAKIGDFSFMVFILGVVIILFNFFLLIVKILDLALFDKFITWIME